MGRRPLPAILTALLVAAIAACGAQLPSTVPATDAAESPTAVPDPTPTAVPGATTMTPVPGGHVTPTITVEPGVEADGPGGSISHAIANAGIGPQLVNGILLREVDGTVWLCEVLLPSSPPQCAEPRLLVENGAQQDQTFVNDQGLHEADGVRWVEKVQVFGVVRP